MRVKSLVLGMLLLAASLAEGRAQGDAPLADDPEVIQARALVLVNETRAEHGLPPLVLENRLNVAAQAHADDMFTRRYYNHSSPEGYTAHDRYVEAGGSKWRLVAENIALCKGCRPPARISVINRLHRGWLESPEHRANILRPGLTHFGFGMVVDEERMLYAVQTFAGPGLPRGLAPGEEAPLAAEEQARQAIRLINEAREQAGGTRLEESPLLKEAAQILLPEGRLEDFDLESRQNLLSRSQRRRWASISVLSAACGGCGTTPTAADVRNFARQWLEDPSYKKDLLDARVTHVGFLIATNGDGMKIALAVLGLK